MDSRSRFALSALALLLLAGCSTPGDPVGPVDVTADTGGIRGVVVDAAVTPVRAATVRLHTGESTETDDGGVFTFSRLAPGEYFLTVQKIGYIGGQSTALVVAGVADPPLVKVVLERIAGFNPYHETFKLDGFYECAYGIPVQTDSCDWAYRTAWDEYNHTQGPPPGEAPRTVQRSHNTEYYDVAPSVQTIIQEAFWTNTDVSEMMISFDHTPIDNACDCSPSYLNVVQASPTYGRIDKELGEEGAGNFPSGVTGAARGFIPFTDFDAADPASVAALAVNHDFVILTTFFHNYPAPDGWTYETREQYPIPE